MNTIEEIKVAAVAHAIAIALGEFGTAAVLDALGDAVDALGDAAATTADHLADVGPPKTGHPTARLHSAAKQLRDVKDTILAAEKDGLPLAAAADVLAELAVE